MNIFTLTESQIVATLLIFVRVGAVCVTGPLLSNARVPLPVRAALSLLLALLLRPLVAPAGPEIHGDILVFGLLLCKEAIVGMIIGYMANLVFSVVEMAGELQDTQSGFGFAGVVDPNFSQSSAILGQFQMIFLWLIYLTLHGHHLLLQALVRSFQVIPLGELAYHAGMSTNMLAVAGALMLLAVKISAPVVASVLLADLALGMLQRTAPQLNIVAVGFQVKISVAVIVLILTLPFLFAAQRDAVSLTDRLIDGMLALGR